MNCRKLLTLEHELTMLQRRRQENALAQYRPYPKQKEFHDAGHTFKERLFMAGNQLGKTWAGGFEIAMHATGLYPDWWRGRRFDRPVRLWVSGVTSESTRDNPQRVLIGPAQQKENWGSGAVPKDCLRQVQLARSLTGALDYVRTSHVSGGESVISFKSYEKGREKWQGETLDGVWFDEEPPPAVYSEGVTRTQVSNGFVIVTFTPLKGISDIVRLFLESETS